MVQDDEQAAESHQAHLSRHTERTQSQVSTRSKTKSQGGRRKPHPMPSHAFARSSPTQQQPYRPAYSLAGNASIAAHGPCYVDPIYYQLNPDYRKPPNRPVWGLAKPLPRVIRRGMRRGEDAGGTLEDEEAEVEQPGSAEVIPQIGLINEQREEAGKEKNSGPDRSIQGRGYGHQPEPKRESATRQFSARTQGTATYSDSGQNGIGRYGSPQEEKDNPMESITQGIDSLNNGNGDIGSRRLDRLPSVKEESHSNLNVQRTVSMSSGQYRESSMDIDLEAGDRIDDWPLDHDEAEQYLIEEKDNHNTWASIRAKFREPLAECLATMVAVLIGLATNLAVLTSNDTSGSYQSANWAWGLGFTIGIYIAGGISGAHLNPAISLMLSLFRGFPFRKALIYISAQIVGALLAGLVAYAIYKDAIVSFDQAGGKSGSTDPVDLARAGTGTAFYTQPLSFTSSSAAFANEFVATAILSCAILALGDDSNAPPGAGMHALIVGLLVTVLTMAFGYNTGACLNPARDFGPRLATAIVGYGGQVFSVADAWWIWGPWGATVSGALGGGLLYDLAIFVGGESPVNYPRARRRKVKERVKENSKRRWWSFRRGLESGAKDRMSKEG